MKKGEVRGLNWINVTNYVNNIPATFFDRHEAFITVEDVDNFVNDIFRDVARKLQLPYEDILPILKQENENFFEVKVRIFTSMTAINKASFSQLITLLKIPDITSVPSVEKVLTVFSNLTDLEKLEVLEKLKLVSIDIKVLSN